VNDSRNIVAIGGNNAYFRAMTMLPNVLFVDDSPVTCRLFTTLLEDRGYKVTPAGGGPEALALFSQTVFDFVITDFHLRSPLTGIDVLRYCEKTRPSTARILITALDCDDVDELVKELGAVCITKPVDIEKLMACLEPATA
jgi:CheY-like chemotaxis protein